MSSEVVAVLVDPRVPDADVRDTAEAWIDTTVIPGAGGTYIGKEYLPGPDGPPRDDDERDSYMSFIRESWPTAEWDPDEGRAWHYEPMTCGNPQFDFIDHLITYASPDDLPEIVAGELDPVANIGTVMTPDGQLHEFFPLHNSGEHVAANNAARSLAHAFIREAFPEHRIVVYACGG